MAVPTNLYVTESGIGIREDVSELIHNISPVETPFLSSIGTTDARQQFHQWQKDDLEAPAENAAVEGDDPTMPSVDETELVGNYCQISEKTFGVSGTYEVVGKYGRDSQLAYLAAKKARSLKTDVDLGMTGVNRASAAGASATERYSGSLEAWLETNVDLTASGSPANGGFSGGIVSARTDGTPRTFTSALLDTVLASCWDEGAKPTLIITGATNKEVFGSFDGLGNAANATATRSDRAGRTVFASADFYWSHLLERLTVVPSRHIRKTSGADRNVFCVDPEYAKIAYLRPWQQYDLAKTGDNIRRQMVVEWALEVCTEKAHGLVPDCGG